MERDRRVAGDVLLRKGHMDRDCLRRASIVEDSELDLVDWNHRVLLQLITRFYKSCCGLSISRGDRQISHMLTVSGP